MEFKKINIESYIQNSLQTTAWKKYKEEYESNTPFFKLPISELYNFFPLTFSHFKSISESLKKRIIFDMEYSLLSSQSHNTFVKIMGKIKQLYNVQPYPKSITFECKNCKKKWTHILSIPILEIDHTAFLCGQHHCTQYLQNKAWNEETYEYIDVIKGSIIISDTKNNNQNIHIYAQNDPKFGFLEIKNKLFDALELNSYITIYGYCRIEKNENEYQYFIEICDLELYEKNNIVKMIPFYSIESPSNEKELVMSLFFSNLEYMKHYLNFNTYKIQKKYPDLILYSKNETKYIEFEYDVANFYHHKHHEQIPKCDLIIAWKCTTNRFDIPYLLLSSFKGTYISEQFILKYTPQYIFDCLIHILAHQYPIIDVSCIPYLLFFLIDFPISIQTITDLQQISLSFDTPIDLTKIQFLQYTKNNHIIIINNSSSNHLIKLKKNSKNEQIQTTVSSYFNHIFEIKQYIQYLSLKKMCNTIYYSSEMLNYLFQSFSSFEHIDYILILLSLFAYFFQIHEITLNFLLYFKTLFSQFFSLSFFT